MNTEQLQYFIIASKHLNFSEAAKELYVTQPTISNQISALEKELGVKLFERSTRKIALTKDGQMFLDDAKRLLDIKDNAIEKLKHSKENREMSLDIAYLLAPCKSFLPKLIMQFKRLYPSVELRLHRMDGNIIRHAIDEDECDLYFGLSKDISKKGKRYFKIFKDNYCLICSHNHPCASINKIDYDKLASETFLALNPDVGPYMSKDIGQFIAGHEYSFKNVIYLDSMEEILFYVECDMGISILPGRNQDIYHNAVTYLPLQGAHSNLEFGVAYSNSKTNPAVPLFLEVLEGYR